MKIIYKLAKTGTVRYNFFTESRLHRERIAFMRKNIIVLFSILCVLTIIVSCSGPQKSTEEEYDNFVGLLNEAKMEVDRLKQMNQSGENNRCFVSAVDKCHASYEIARKAWKQKLETDDDKRKQDMEMAYSFSISFATLNIEKANNCYK
jgi:hypothetical protein